MSVYCCQSKTGGGGLRLVWIIFEELQSVQFCQTSGNAANLKARGKVKCFSNVPDALETSCILGQSIFSNVFYQLIVP